MRRAAITAAMFAALSGGAAAQAPASGEFQGELTWAAPCLSEQRTGTLPVIAGIIENGVLRMTLPRRQRVRVPIAPDGSFRAEAELRPDPLGTKMQYHLGRIADGRVVIESVYEVPGHPNTRCVSRGEFPVRPRS
ncbi:MAG: hypothetical protein ACK4PG_07370 [Acetobacteraceae bacterium]